MNLTEEHSNSQKRIEILKKYPILSFIIIVLILTYGLGIPFNMWISQNLKIPNPFDIYLSRLITVISPGISAIVLMWCNREKIELKFFFPNSKIIHFYFLIPFLTLIISIISLISGGTPTDLIATIILRNWEQLFFHLILQILIIGIGEEVGWRGWLLPNLNKKYTLIKAMFLLLIIWSLWHFPILFQKSEILIPWLLIITGATMILTWIWKNFGNNILLFAIVHGSINYPQFFWDNQTNNIDSQLILNGWTISGYIYFIIGIVALISMHKVFKTKYRTNTVGNKELR